MRYPYIYKIALLGALLFLSIPFSPVKAQSPASVVQIKGLIVHPEDPFKFDMVLDAAKAGHQVSQEESRRLVKYFLAALSVPEKEMWVNLSPYEKIRIIPANFGQTAMGRDLLEQDYILKQITASLTHPESSLGQ